MTEIPEISHVTDIGSFWRAVGLRPVGASVVTASDDAGPRGFLALSATHLCADPPLMMVSVDEKTSALETILRAQHFAINYLAASQEPLMAIFGGRSELKGADRFTTGEWGQIATGAPTLMGAAGVIDCELVEVIRRHSTAIVVGEVKAFAGGSDNDPLITYRGSFGRYQPST